jgi:hypothetical protein
VGAKPGLVPVPLAITNMKGGTALEWRRHVCVCRWLCQADAFLHWSLPRIEALWVRLLLWLVHSLRGKDGLLGADTRKAAVRRRPE